jgi:hypothetical protein
MRCGSYNVKLIFSVSPARKLKAVTG